MNIFVDLWEADNDNDEDTTNRDRPSTTLPKDKPPCASVEVPLWTMQEVIDWITQIGYNEFIDRFKDKGVDGDSLLNLTEKNVRFSIGIESSLSLQRFMREVHNLKRTADYSSQDNTDLKSFLVSIDPEFSVYTYPMLKAGVDRNCLASLSEDQLTHECGITNSIHRRKILDTIKEGMLLMERPLHYRNADEKLDGFISYRRSNGSEFASLLYFKLECLGYSTFLDTECLGPGKFDNNLKNNIKRARNFLLVLTPNSLDRCIGDNDCHDWVHKEIVTAIEYKCNIFLITDNFQWPDVDALPEDMRIIAKYQSIAWEHEYQDECVDKMDKFMWTESNVPRCERSASVPQVEARVCRQKSLQHIQSAPSTPLCARKSPAVGHQRYCSDGGLDRNRNDSNNNYRPKENRSGSLSTLPCDALDISSSTISNRKNNRRTPEWIFVTKQFEVGSEVEECGEIKRVESRKDDTSETHITFHPKKQINNTQNRNAVVKFIGRLTSYTKSNK